MGRVKSKAIKTLATSLIKEHGEKFSTDFIHNKEVLKQIKPIKSKRVRNILVGYISKEIKKIKKTGV